MTKKTTISTDTKEITEFNFNDSVVLRATIDKQGEPIFVAKDIAEALGYSDTKKAVEDNCKNAIPFENVEFQVGHISTPDFDSLHPHTKIIQEPDLYRLILRSQLPAAEPFQDWVTEEVLPTLRKEGLYSMSANANPVYLPKNYGYHTVATISAAIGVSIVQINKILCSKEYQTPAIDKEGRMYFKLTSKGKEKGILQDTVKVKGMMLPREVYWNKFAAEQVARSAGVEPKLIE